MQHTTLSPATYLLRLERGEEIIKTLFDFCQKNEIYSGWFQGLGAVSKAQLALYRLKDKKYFERKLKKPLEIASMFGIISREKLHTHCVLTNQQMKACGGHLVKAVVSATCEVVLHKGEKEIDRVYDKDIGLDLLSLT